MGNDLVQVFLKIVNMSITAAYVALFVCVVRLALKKSPKVISYSLWAVVLFRLLCPVSFSSAISLLGLGNVSRASEGGSVTYVGSSAPVSGTAALWQPVVQSSSGAPAPGSIAAPSAVETLIFIAAFVWAAGVAVMLIISAISHIRLKRSISGAALLCGNVYESGAIPSPFVYGIIKPRIYVPAGLDNKDLAYVLSHERMHIARRDNVIKPIAYAALCLHWFNPVMWAAFHLMCRDMEMSCDERVLRGMEARDKAGYGEALLKLASKRSVIAGSPLAFGESSVKARIKNVLRFRKPVIWIAAIAVIAAAAVGVCLVANPGLTAPAITDELYGKYRFEKQVYMNSLSSFLADESYEEYYTLTKDALIITEGTGKQQSFDIGYEPSGFNERDFKALFMEPEVFSAPDTSRYKQRYQYILCEATQYSAGYTLYLMDNEIWLARVNRGRDGVKYIWSIYSVEKYLGYIPAENPAATESPETLSSMISGIETSFSKDELEIVLNIGGEEIRDLIIADEAQKQIVEDAVAGFMQDPAKQAGIKGRPTGDYMVLDWDMRSQFLIYNKDGNYCIQNEVDGMYSILDDKTYDSLLDIALGYYDNPYVLTIASGKNSVYAFENTLWTQIGNYGGDMGDEVRLKPEQVAGYIQYLPAEPDRITHSPFTPYINGKEVDGKYTIYNMDFEILAIVGSPPTEALEKRALLFNDVKWPGTYIVELEATYESDGMKMQNQYFFGVILPERPKGRK